MHSTRTFKRRTFVLFLLVVLVAAHHTAAAGPRRTRAVRAQTSCAGKPTDCKLPTRYLGEKDGCACFACGIGTKMQRVICTKDRQQQAVLMSQARKSGKVNK